MARLKRLEIWSELACNTGARLAVIPRDRIITAEETREINGDERLDIDLDPIADILAQVQHERVIRVLYDDDAWDEYRIREIRRTRGANGALGYNLVAKSVKFDLQTKAPLVEYSQANYDSWLHHEFASLTPEDYVDALIALTDWPSYFVKGTIDPTEKRDFVSDWETYLSALTELATVTECELVVTRNGTTNYQVHILTQENASAEKPFVTLKKNILSSDVHEDSTELGTWVYPKGEGQQGEAAQIGDCRFIASAGGWGGTSSGPIWLDYADTSAGFTAWPDAMNEDDQFNGLYMRWWNYQTEQYYVWPITDSSVNGTYSYVINLTVNKGADPSFPTGKYVPVWLCKDSAGSQLNYVPLPSAVAQYGIRPYVLERDDIPGIQNMLNDPFFENGHTWTYYEAIGGATLSTITAPSPYVQYGDSAIKVVCPTAGDGFRRKAQSATFADVFGFHPTPDKPNISWQTSVFVKSGRLKFQLVHDVTNPPGPEPPYTVTYPYGLDEDDNPLELKTEAVENWYHLAVEPALVNFWLTDGQYGEPVNVDIEWVALDDNTEFYVDAIQAVPEIVSAPKIVRGSSYAQLWAAGIEALKSDITKPKLVLDIDVLDLERLNGATYQYDAIDRGVTLLIRDPALDQDIERRVFSVRRNLMQEALTQIELEQE